MSDEIVETQIVDIPEKDIEENDYILVQNFNTKEIGILKLDRKNNFLQKHAVGSLFITITDINPNEVYGGTWTKVAEGKGLWGAGQNEQAGQTADGKVPNITGSVASVNCNNFSSCLKGDPSTYIQKRGTATPLQVIDFDASRSNQKYTNDNIVQSESYLVHFWLRNS